MAFDLSTAQPVADTVETDAPASDSKIDLTKIQIEPRKGKFDLSTARPVEADASDTQPLTAGPASPARAAGPDTSIPYLTDIGHALRSEAHGIADAPVGVIQLASHLSPSIPVSRPLDLIHPERNNLTGLAIDRIAQKREQDIQAERTAQGDFGFDAYRLLGNAMSPSNYILPESKSLNVLSRVGRSALQGATASVQQPVAGDNFWKTKAEQGALGAVAGTVLHPAVALAKAVATPIVKPIYNFVKGIKGDEAVQNDAVAEILKRIHKDGTKTQDILDLLNSAPGKPLNLTDLGGENVKALAGRIARLPGEGRQIITKALNDRDLDAGLRLSADVNTGIKGGSSHVAAKVLAESRAAQAGPLYDEAFKANQNMASPEIDGILATPAGTAALKKAATKMQNDMTLAGKPDPELLQQAREAGQYIPFKGGVASGLKMRTLDYVKRSLDDQIGTAKRAGENDEVRILSGLKSKLVKAMDAADLTAKPGRPARPGKVGQRAGSPAVEPVLGAYARARGVYSGASQSMEALEDGEKFLTSSPEEIADRVKTLSDGDREFYKMGAAATLRARIAKAGIGSDESSKVIGSAYTRQQLRPLFDSDEEFDKFVGAVTAERTMFNTRAQVLGGSQTAARLAEDSSPMTGIYKDAALAAVYGHGGYPIRMTHKALDALHKWSVLTNPARDAEMARILTTPLQGGGMNFLRNYADISGGPGLRNLLAGGGRSLPPPPPVPQGGVPGQNALAPSGPAGAPSVLNTPAPQVAAGMLHPEAAMSQLKGEFGEGMVSKLQVSGKLNIVRFAADLPPDVDPALKARAVKDPTIKGFYNGDGRSFIIADRHTPSSIRGAFLHEVGEHHSLGEMMGQDRYNQYLTNLAKSAHPEVKEAAAHVDKFYPEYKKSDPMYWREVSARLAETSPDDSPWWKSIYQGVRNWATKQGIKLNLTPQDVRTLVKQALNNQAKADVRLVPSAQVNTAPTFYSALERNLQDKPGLPVKADAQRWSEWLDGAQRRGEIKKEERDWTGIDEWLKTHQGQVTRDQIKQFAAEQKVQLQDRKPETGIDEHAVNEAHDDFRDALANGDEYIWKAVFGHINGGRMPQDINDREEFLAKWLEDKSDTPEGSKALDNLDELVGYRVGSDPSLDGRYAEYQLPGGTNYREHVLTYSPTEESAKIEARLAELDKGRGVRPAAENEEYIRLFERLKQVKGGKDIVYNSPHWDEPNIIAHIRTNDRVLGGKKDLHVEEVQSDWHQAGREEGYKDPKKENPFIGRARKFIDSPLEAKYTPGPTSFGDQWEVSLKGTNDVGFTLQRSGRQTGFPKSEAEAINMAKDHYTTALKTADRDDDRVPDAPFKKTWDLLAMKQMIRRGAEEGYDRISWTPGAEQNARYAGRGAEEEAGMKKFYDEIMPRKVADYIKKWGGKIETGEIDKPLDHSRVVTSSMKDGKTGVVQQYWEVPIGDGQVKKFSTRAEAEAFDKSTQPKVQVQYFDITPEMRKAALQGQPMFQKGGTAAKPAPDRAVNFLSQMKKSEAQPANNLRPDRLKRILRSGAAVGAASRTQPSSDQ